MALTGERTMPGIASENYWFRRHEATYRHLLGEVRGPWLLEVGAGEGYGAALLAQQAAGVRGVLALDYDAAAVSHLSRRYPQLGAVRGNLAALPVADASIDTLVSLQVIEHVWDHPQFLAECVRVLRPGGLLVLSTPNRLTFSPGASGADRPLNPFHTHEFTAAELVRLVAGAGLAVRSVHGLFAGRRLAELDRRHSGLVAAQLAGPPQDWPAELAADVASVDWRDFEISPDLRAELGPAGRQPGPDPAGEAAVSQVGRFSLVLHTHLPWVAHNGTWPVGEEWLHQAFTGSWRRVIRVLEGLAEHGFTDVVTLGVTPVVAAMLDDPYCLSEIHSWAGRWQLRAEELAGRPGRSALAEHERREAVACLEDLQRRWLTGGLSAVLRPLADAGVLELLSGPATHPFQPLLTERFAAAQLATGLADARLRFGSRPGGIWAPECGYAPGMEDFYAAHGVTHFLVDGPAVRGDTGLARPVGDSDVLAFARDLDLSYRVWSSRTGYPGDGSYRDFHTYRPRLGFPAGPGHRRRRAAGGQAALGPAAGRGGGAARRPGLRRRGGAPADRAARPARPGGAGGGGVRHRAVRALVVRGAAVPRRRAADAAAGRGSAEHPARRG